MTIRLTPAYGERGASMLEYIIALALLLGSFIFLSLLFDRAFRQRAESSYDTVTAEMAPCCVDPDAGNCEVPLQGNTAGSREECL